jgi:glycerol uptake facilitator-like aquaporin
MRLGTGLGGNGRMGSSESWIVRYLRKNPGADFIASFLVALILVAFVHPLGEEPAKQFANLAFVSLIAGIALQGLSLTRDESKVKT